MVTLRWLGARLLTFGLYLMGIIGTTSWDRDPDNAILIVVRLGGTAMFFWWAVDRTIHHHHEDREIE